MSTGHKRHNTCILAKLDQISTKTYQKCQESGLSVIQGDEVGKSWDVAQMTSDETRTRNLLKINTKNVNS